MTFTSRFYFSPLETFKPFDKKWLLYYLLLRSRNAFCAIFNGTLLWFLFAIKCLAPKKVHHKANHFNLSRSLVHQHQHALCQTTQKILTTASLQLLSTIFGSPGFQSGGKIGLCGVVRGPFSCCCQCVCILVLFFCICIWWRWWRLLLDAAIPPPSLIPRSLGVDLGPARLRFGSFSSFLPWF